MLDLQLDFVRSLQYLRHPFLDTLIGWLNYFDRPEFIFILIPFLWLKKGWRLGLAIFYALSLNIVLNHFFKLLFALPRPFHLDSSVGLIPVHGYGFPSGAAQNAMLLASMLVTYGKGRFKWAIALSYLLLISFSRLYLGVHFPMDILGGWGAGLLVFALCAFTYRWVKPYLEFIVLEKAIPCILLLPLVFMLLFPDYTIISLVACIIGLSVGIYLNYSLKVPAVCLVNQTDFWLCWLITVSGGFLLYLLPLHFELPNKVTLFARFLVIGLWFSFLSIPLCNLVKRLFFARAKIQN